VGCPPAILDGHHDASCCGDSGTGNSRLPGGAEGRQAPGRAGSRSGARLHGRTSDTGRSYVARGAERRPVDRRVSDVPGDAFQERTVDVTTHREEPVVAKEARVKEEIRVRKESDQRTETVQDTVRHTKVEIEDDRGKTSAPASPSATPPRR